jgi:uncharacterized protein
MNMLVAGFAIGFLGSSHCIAMCGGLAAALPSSTQSSASVLRRTLAYNAGRLASYTLAGAVAGGIGGAFAGMGGAAGHLALRGLSALLVLGVGLYIGGWSSRIAILEKLGGGIWRKVAPLARRARAAESTAAGFAFGAMWGWLPCGLVYSTLVVAAASGSSLDGALAMAGFGLGTLPALVAIGLAAGRGATMLRSHAMRQVAGAMVIAFGLWTFIAAASASVRLATTPAASCHEVEASGTRGGAPAAAPI